MTDHQREAVRRLRNRGLSPDVEEKIGLGSVRVTFGSPDGVVVYRGRISVMGQLYGVVAS